jgi:hypothetical protein
MRDCDHLYEADMTQEAMAQMLQAARPKGSAAYQNMLRGGVEGVAHCPHDPTDFMPPGLHLALRIPAVLWSRQSSVPRLHDE